MIGVPRTGAIFSILALLSMPGYGADLLEIYREAMASDPRVRRAEAQLAVYQSREKYQFGGLLPQVQLSNQMTRTKRDSTTRRGLTEENYYNGEKYYASLTQPLYDKSAWQAWRRSGHQSGQYLALLEATRSKIATNVVKSYTQVLGGEDNLEFVMAEKRAAEKQLRLVKARYEREMARVTDVFAAEARVDRLYAQEVDALSQVEIARESLSEMLGREVDEPLDGLATDGVDFGWRRRSKEDWLRLGIASSRELIARRRAVKSALGRVKEAVGRYYPTVNLRLSAQKSDIGFENSSVPEYEVYVASLNVTVPLYTGGQTSARVSEARANLIVAEQEYEQAERALRKKVSEAYLRIRGARRRVVATRKAVRSARKDFEARNKGLQYGTVTVVDVLDASQRLYEARRDHNQAFYDLMVQGVRLRQLTGLFEPKQIAMLNDNLSP